MREKLRLGFALSNKSLLINIISVLVTAIKKFVKSKKNGKTVFLSPFAIDN